MVISTSLNDLKTPPPERSRMGVETSGAKGDSKGKDLDKRIKKDK